MRARRDPCLLKALSHRRPFGFENPRRALGDVSDGAEDTDLREQEKPLLKPKMKPPYSASGKFTPTQHNGIQGSGKLTSSGTLFAADTTNICISYGFTELCSIKISWQKKKHTLLLKEQPISGSSPLLQKLWTAVIVELPVVSPSKTSVLNRHKKMLGNFPTEIRAPT